MKWPAYSAYKSSKTDWMGVVPSNWSIERMSWLFSEISSGTTPDSKNPEHYGNDVNWVTTGELRERGIAQTEKQLTHAAVAQHSALKVYPPGTLLIAMYGATIGRLGWLEDYACTNQACCAFASPLRVETRFAYYALSAARDHLVLLASGGGQPNINQDKLRSLRIALPSRQEQSAIAAVLDRETAKIDALIANQQKLIATLHEDRTATITHAVTRGLDDNVEMVESGFKWMGAIPAHWRQVPLRRLVGRIEQGVSPEAYAELAEDGWGVLKSGCVNGGVFRDGEHKKLPEGFEIEPAIVVHEGDLLVSRASGSPELVGSAAIVRDLRFQLILSDKTFRLVPGALVLADFLEWVLNSRMYREQVKGAISGAEGLANNLPMSSLRAFRFPIPPLAEQRSIATRLKKYGAEIAVLIAKAEQVVDILREYRAALISDTVTGKIDVRGAA